MRLNGLIDPQPIAQFVVEIRRRAAVAPSMSRWISRLGALRYQCAVGRVGERDASPAIHGGEDRRRAFEHGIFADQEQFARRACDDRALATFMR